MSLKSSALALVMRPNLQGYDVGKTLVHRFSSVPSTGMTLPQYAAAGFFSAIPMTAITAPFERIKIVLQIQGQSSVPGQKQYTGGIDALRGIYKDGGFRSGANTRFSFLLGAANV